MYIYRGNNWYRHSFRSSSSALLSTLNLVQDRIQTRGYAIQCRVTTENPADNFKPVTGKIEVYRSAGGNAGAAITPHYDSLLVKVTCWGMQYEITTRKIVRALVEFRMRGFQIGQRLLTIRRNCLKWLKARIVEIFW